MHTPSYLIGHPIGQMDNIQVVHTTMVTQDTHPPYHTSQISTPYIGGQPSIPSTTGKVFTRGKPTWLQHQHAWGKVTPTIPFIHTTIDLYLVHPYPRVVKKHEFPSPSEKLNDFMVGSHQKMV